MMPRLLIFAITGFVLACGDAPPSSTAVFREVATEIGLAFRHHNGMTGERYIVEMMGPGGALADVDGDGDLDAVLLQGTELGPGNEANRAEHRLFLNQLIETGSLGFVDAGDAGLAGPGYATGVASGDIDNDGDVDLYLTAFGPNRLMINLGDGTFEDRTMVAGAGDDRWTATATFFDADADGHLDLFVGNYLAFGWANHKVCYEVSSVPDYCGPSSYPPATDKLLRNRGDGTFEDVTTRAGLHTAIGKALGVVTLDADDDGRLDLLVANDDMENYLWRNDGGFQFVEEGLERGVAVNGSGGTEGSMGIAIGDYDLDGDEDVLLTHLVGESNTLYRNDDGLFSDVSAPSGLASPSLPYTAFGAGFVDWDRDGALDLVVVNGAVMAKREQVDAGVELPLAERDQLFRNQAPGSAFEARFVEEANGVMLEHTGVGRGAAFGDVDNDGDTDVLLVDNHGPVRLWLGQPAGGRWLGLRVLDHGRDASGAWVTVTGSTATGETRSWVRRVRADGSYASASDSRVLVGLGDEVEVERVDVRFVDGGEESWSGLALDRYHELRRGDGS